jgi:large-conductance mechanosensitive channel
VGDIEMSELKRKHISQQEVLIVAIGLVIGFALKDFVEKFLAAFVTPILDKINAPLPLEILPSMSTNRISGDDKISPI